MKVCKEWYFHYLKALYLSLGAMEWALKKKPANPVSSESGLFNVNVMLLIATNLMLIHLK